MSLTIVPGSAVNKEALREVREARLAIVNEQVQKIEDAYPDFANAPPEYVRRHHFLSAESAELTRKLAATGGAA